MGFGRDQISPKVGTYLPQLGKLRGAELKLDELILARSGWSLAQIRASLQAQLGKLWRAELKLGELKLAWGGRSLAHIRARELKLAHFMALVCSNQFY